MHILIVASDAKRAAREGVKEFRRRVAHAGWVEETTTLADFLRHPPDPRNYDDFAVAGGDGTVNACLAASGRLPIVVVPAGTGNDLARSLDIWSEGDAGRALRSGHRVKIDLGVARSERGEERFANGVGIGLDGRVAAHHGRGLPYAVAAFSAIARLPTFRARITIDGKSEDAEFLSLLVANGAWFGGGFKLAPRARLDDGLLDLVLIRPVTRKKFIQSFKKAQTGAHVNDEAVVMRQGMLIIIESDQELPWHLDGEVRSSRRIEISVRPKEKAFYSLKA